MKFKLRDKDAPFVGSSGVSGVELSPAKLVEVFGKPDESDEYKVSGEYTFDTPNGGVITLYDWKATILYDPDYPTPEELWSSDDFDFSMGGDDLGKQQVSEFKEWIKSRLTNSVRFIVED